MKTLFVLLLLFSFLPSFTRADEFSEAVVKAKKELADAWDQDSRDGIVKARGKFERILQLKKNEWLVNYWLAFCDYALSMFAMEKKNYDEVKKYTESAMDLLDKVTDTKEDFGEAWILKMAVNSNRWSYEMDKMNEIMGKDMEADDMSKKYDSQNPRYFLVRGMNTYYTPESFGGGYKNAQPLFEKSIEAFAVYKAVDETYPDWGYEAACGMMAMCMLKQDKLDDARKWIDKALEKNPNSGFINGYVKKEYEKAKK